ncbi:MAG: PmbA/TldA family metallopeptidase, partial [Candidatus Aminicenantales bacterium]
MPRKENLQKKPARCPFERKFGLTRKELESALEHALIRGGEFSEIFLEYRVHHAVNMEEGLIKDTTESISVGAGVRVLFGEQTGYAYTSDLTLPQMKRAAVTAASIAKTKNGPRHPGLKLSKAASPYNLYPVLRPAHEARVETKIALVQKAYASALG